MRGLWVLVLVLAAFALPSLALRVGAFNVQTFGDSKLSNDTIADLIAQIVSGYDITLVQEVRDADLSAVRKLMHRLNQASVHPFSYVVSKPLGRSTYKEQYLFIYRQDQASLLDSYYFDDGCESCGNDTFSREPFVVRFAVPRTELGELILVPLHAAPNDAVLEIDALYDVYLDVKHRWGIQDVLLLGDFNAGCSFVRAQDWSLIRLRTEPAFQWLIPDEADTTAGPSNCAYDRIVAAGAHLQGSLLPGSAQVNNFQEAFRLSNKDALAVSDHYPVGVTLRSN